MERLLAGVAGHRASFVRERFGIRVFVTVCECECDSSTAGGGEGGGGGGKAQIPLAFHHHLYSCQPPGTLPHYCTPNSSSSFRRTGLDQRDVSTTENRRKKNRVKGQFHTNTLALNQISNYGSELSRI